MTDDDHNLLMEAKTRRVQAEIGAPDPDVAGVFALSHAKEPRAVYAGVHVGMDMPPGSFERLMMSVLIAAKNLTRSAEDASRLDALIELFNVHDEELKTNQRLDATQ